MNKKNIRMAAFIVVGVVIWMLLGLFAPKEREFERPPAQKLTVLTSNSIAQDYSLPITSKSESEAFSKIDLKSQTSEKIVKVNFKDGDFVNKGDVICQLDSGQREANFKRRDIEYQSQKELKKKGLVSDSALVTSETNYETARIELERTRIKAPFNGFVEYLAKEGQLLQNGQNCGWLISLSPLKIVGNIPEMLVSKVKVGQKVLVRFLSGEEYESNVTFVSSGADAQTKTFRVETELDNISSTIKDGLTGEMVIYTDPVKAHFIPSSAFLLADNGDVALAYVVEGVVKIDVVQILRDTKEGAWVTGLPETARIIISGQGFVKENDEVNYIDN